MSVAPVRQREHGLTPEPVSSFLKRQLRRDASIIEGGVLPEKSVQVIGGMSKIGKSIMAMNEALCIASGKPFLLQFEVPRPRRVIYFQAEISLGPLQKRLRTMIEAENIEPEAQERFFHVPSCKGIKITQYQHLRHVMDACKDIGAEVVIIDPLSRFFMGNENHAMDVQKLVDAIDQMVARLGVSVILVHHHGKPPQDGNGQRQGAQQLRGSSVLFDAFDSYLSLNKKNGKQLNGYARLAFELRNEADPQPMTIHRDPETLWWQLVDEEPAGRAGAAVSDVVLAIEELGGKADRSKVVDQLKARTGLKGRAVGDLIRRAVGMKRIYEETLPGKGSPKRLWLPETWAEQGKAMPAYLRQIHLRQLASNNSLPQINLLIYKQIYSILFGAAQSRSILNLPQINTLKSLPKHLRQSDPPKGGGLLASNCPELIQSIIY